MSSIFYNKASFARPSVGVGGVAGEMMPPLQPELEDLLNDKYVSVSRNLGLSVFRRAGCNCKSAPFKQRVRSAIEECAVAPKDRNNATTLSEWL